MKKYTALCIALALCISVSFAAAQYRDDFDVKESKALVTGLTQVPSVSQVLMGTPIPDDTAVGLSASGERSGTIVYDVRGAETLTIGFYSRYSGYASRSGEQYILGLPNKPYAEELYPVYIDQEGSLYCRIGDRWKQYIIDGTGGKFEDAKSVPNQYRTLHISVEVSAGGSYSELTAFHSSGVQQIMHNTAVNQRIGYYEERTYAIPKGTEQIRIVAGSLWRYDTAPGIQVLPVNDKYPVMVASVELAGAALSFGREESSSPPSDSGSSGNSGGSTGGGSGSSGGGVVLPESDGGRNDQNSAPSSEPEKSSSPSSSQAPSRPQSSSQSSSAPVRQNRAGTKTEEEPDSSSNKLDYEEQIQYNEEKTLHTSRDEGSSRLLIYLLLGGYCLIGGVAAYLVYQKNWKKRSD